MGGAYSFCIAFSGITVRFVLPSPVALPDCFSDLQCADTATPDVEYQICLLNEPLRPHEPALYTLHAQEDMLIYRTQKGWLRIFPTYTAGDGCQVACLFCPDGHHTLFYPASKWGFYSTNWRCIHLICCENLLLSQNAFLLHSSVVTVNGKAVLFSGRSGAGKSTQAKLWAEYLGADILNGDRTVVMKKPDGFYGGGSPWCGSSRIHRREQAPIAGIFLVNQAEENRVERLGIEAFVPLFSQTIVNSWDEEFIGRVTGLYADLLAQVPVYRLHCRAEEAAATLAYETLFGRKTTP